MISFLLTDQKCIAYLRRSTGSHSKKTVFGRAISLKLSCYFWQSMWTTISLTCWKYINGQKKQKKNNKVSIKKMFKSWKTQKPNFQTSKNPIYLRCLACVADTFWSHLSHPRRSGPKVLALWAGQLCWKELLYPSALPLNFWHLALIHSHWWVYILLFNSIHWRISAGCSKRHLFLWGDAASWFTATL